MKTARKALMLILCAALLVSATVMGTLAYLTAESKTVTNTFTVGNITITLAETEEGPFKIVPGATDDKDPTVTVVQGSEECYVYALITNNLVLDNKAVANVNVDTTNSWTLVKSEGNKTLYRYNKTVDAASEAATLPVFTKVTYSPEITESNITTLDGETIVIQAYAHQSATTTQEVADAAAKTWAGF